MTHNFVAIAPLTSSIIDTEGAVLGCSPHFFGTPQEYRESPLIEEVFPAITALRLRNCMDIFADMQSVRLRQAHIFGPCGAERLDLQAWPLINVQSGCCDKLCVCVVPSPDKLNEALRSEILTGVSFGPESVKGQYGFIDPTGRLIQIKGPAISLNGCAIKADGNEVLDESFSILTEHGESAATIGETLRGHYLKHGPSALCVLYLRHRVHLQDRRLMILRTIDCAGYLWGFAFHLQPISSLSSEDASSDMHCLLEQYRLLLIRIGYDLREPLNVIQGITHLLLNRHPSHELQEGHLEQLFKTATTHMSDLLGSARTIPSIGARPPKGDADLTSVRSCIQAAIALTTGTYPVKRVVLKDCAADTTLLVDRTVLTEILINLLHTALQTGLPDSVVEIRIARQLNTVTILITYFPAQEVDKTAAPWDTAAEEHRWKLGISVCNHLASTLKGTLTLTAETDERSAMVLALPRLTAPSAP